MKYQIIADSDEINQTNITKWINEFKQCILPVREKLGAYYDGINKIDKQGAVEGRPNYSINVNMAKYIVDVATGYTFGSPISYTTQNDNTKSILEKILYINKNCNSDEVDFQQGGDMSTYGVSYQLIMALDNNMPIEDRIVFKYLNPLQTFYVIDNTILQNPLCAVYFYNYKENNQEKTKVYVYDDTYLHIYNGAYGTVTTLESSEPHNMGYIPIIQCLNNDDAFSDFQCVTDLLDSLSLAISNNTDNLQSIANAILAVSGGTLSDKQIEQINKFKVANIPGGASMQWVIKNINPEAEKMQIDNLLKFVFQISQVPDLTDSAFGGNQSGVAMKYKLWGLDQLWVTKTTKYKKAIVQRLKILLHLLQYQFENNVKMLDEIEISFMRNLPQDNSEAYQMVQALKDVVSDRNLLTQLAKYSLVDDVEKELEELEAQAEKNADLYGFKNNLEIDNEEDKEDEQ